MLKNASTRLKNSKASQFPACTLREKVLWGKNGYPEGGGGEYA